MLKKMGHRNMKYYSNSTIIITLLKKTQQICDQLSYYCEIDDDEIIKEH